MLFFKFILQLTRKQSFLVNAKITVFYLNIMCIFEYNKKINCFSLARLLFCTCGERKKHEIKGEKAARRDGNHDDEGNGNGNGDKHKHTRHTHKHKYKFSAAAQLLPYDDGSSGSKNVFPLELWTNLFITQNSGWRFEGVNGKSSEAHRRTQAHTHVHTHGGKFHPYEANTSSGFSSFSHIVRFLSVSRRRRLCSRRFVPSQSTNNFVACRKLFVWSCIDLFYTLVIDAHSLLFNLYVHLLFFRHTCWIIRIIFLLALKTRHILTLFFSTSTLIDTEHTTVMGIDMRKVLND